MEAIQAVGRMLPDSVPFFKGDPGQEHYKLLAYLASLYNNVDIFDIGTYYGYSALAFASGNKNNSVLSFDLEVKGSPPAVPNVMYYFDNLMESSGQNLWKERLLASPLIMLDIAPHEGVREYDFYIFLRDNNYQGILVCDDIIHFKEMRDNFWDKVAPEHKMDITKFGHWSGTGLIFFNKASVPALFTDKLNL
jgi:hypothetical protein